MSLVSELEKLEQLHQSGSLSQHEFAIAKHKLLNEDSHDQQVADSHVVKIQNDIEELDRSWQIDRENYMSSGKFGKQCAPSKTDSFIHLIWIPLFALCLITLATFLDFFRVQHLYFLTPCALVSIIAVLMDYQKATNYELAKADYQKKRKELLAGKANQNDIKELDRLWQVDREKYMSCSGFFGKQRPPSKTNSIIFLIWIIVFGSYFIIGDVSRGRDSGFSVLIALPFIMCLVLGVEDLIKATNYEIAEAVYQKKRKELLARKAAS